MVVLTSRSIIAPKLVVFGRNKVVVSNAFFTVCSKCRKSGCTTSKSPQSFYTSNRKSRKFSNRTHDISRFWVTIQYVITRKLRVRIFPKFVRDIGGIETKRTTISCEVKRTKFVVRFFVWILQE